MPILNIYTPALSLTWISAVFLATVLPISSGVKLEAKLKAFPSGSDILPAPIPTLYQIFM